MIAGGGNGSDVFSAVLGGILFLMGALFYFTGGGAVLAGIYFALGIIGGVLGVITAPTLGKAAGNAALFLGIIGALAFPGLSLAISIILLRALFIATIIFGILGQTL